MGLIFKLIDHLRFLNRRRIYKRQEHKPLKLSSNGFLFSGIQSYIDGTWEPGTTKVFKKLLDSVSVFVNVGAHHGYFCCIALRNSVETIAFEPEKSNCVMLRKHILANKFSNNFQLYEAAVGSKTSEMKFFGGGDTGTLVVPNPRAPKAQINSVKVVKLDNIIKNKDQKILFLIDAEGFELNVLEGAIGILSSKIKHYFIIELWNPSSADALAPKNENFTNVFSLMENNGYRGWRINEDNGDIIEFNIHDEYTRNLSSVSGSFSNYLFSSKNETHDFFI